MPMATLATGNVQLATQRDIGTPDRPGPREERREGAGAGDGRWWVNRLKSQSSGLHPRPTPTRSGGARRTGAGGGYPGPAGCWAWAGLGSAIWDEDRNGDGDGDRPLEAGGWRTSAGSWQLLTAPGSWQLAALAVRPGSSMLQLLQLQLLAPCSWWLLAPGSWLSCTCWQLRTAHFGSWQQQLIC
jgi:hypothetical protein